MRCAVAADTKLETPEGPLTVKSVGNSPTPVMTRGDDGAVRFAMTSEVRVVAAAQPVLRIALANGRALRVGADQLLLGVDGTACRAGDLRAGDALFDAFGFPVGYTYLTDDGQARVSDGGVAIAAVGPGGEADLYDLRVERAGRFVFSAGVIGLEGKG
ncbi:MAG: hypothetical protein SF182_15725 [Deltaproteobacteria bacterium]|nr:hypothetical protein [Deltaproteobacteria bacterium]